MESTLTQKPQLTQLYKDSQEFELSRIQILI